MSSAAVRAALRSYIAGGAISGLNKVYGAPPYWADGGDWNLGAKFNGAVAALHLVEQKESRITVPAVTIGGTGGGQKGREYKWGLMIFYQWLIPQQTSRVAQDAWNGPLDAILDAVVARLEADPNAGTGGGAGNPLIWQCAQSPNEPRIQRDIPRRLPGSILSWNVVEFTCTEIVQA